MSNLLLNRPQQDLGEYAGVYVPVAHHQQLALMLDDLRANSYANLRYLSNLPIVGTLYIATDITKAEHTIYLLKSYGQHAHVTLDDVARIWWLHKVYDVYSKGNARNMPNPYSVYMRLLRDIKPFMLALKQDILRALLLNHTRAVGELKQPVVQEV